jgi:hypothetical protein
LTTFHFVVDPISVAGEWVETWLSLSGRHLVYSTEDTAASFTQIDLKRTKEVFLRKDSKNLDLPREFAKHPVLVCDFNDRFATALNFHMRFVLHEALRYINKCAKVGQHIGTKEFVSNWKK